MRMTRLNVLLKARQRIEDASHWTRHTLARNQSGERCDPVDREAVQWCAQGAVLWAIRNMSTIIAAYEERGPFRRTIDLLDRTADRLGIVVVGPPEGCSTAMVNDVLGHVAVLAVFDRAIADLRAQAQKRVLSLPHGERSRTTKERGRQRLIDRMKQGGEPAPSERSEEIDGDHQDIVREQRPLVEVV